MRPAKRTTNHRTLLGVESLESKRLLACDVAFDGEALAIDCDDAGDLIFIREQAGDLVVGIDNFGSAENLTKVTVNSGGGGDAIIISDLDVAGNIELNTRGDVVADDDTDDVITFSDVNVGGDLKVSTGQGADYIFFQGTVHVDGKVKATMGKGNDSVFSLFGNLTAEDIKLKGKRGVDTILAVDNLFASDQLKIRNFEIIN